MIKAPFKNYLVIFILITLFFSTLATPLISAQEDGEKWTFMVYMSGDSSLADKVQDDIREMQKVGSSAKLDIIVLADLADIGDTTLSRVLPGGTFPLGIDSVDPAWDAELDLGNPGTLSKFVIWAAGAYPAERYMLDLWGHGNGWPGISPDRGNYLEAHELRTALENVSAAGLRLDIVSMDACQMGMLEIAYEIREHADYALLSQKDIPLDGWPYDSFLKCLAVPGTVAEKGSAMIDAYISWGTAHSYYSLTLAMVDLSGMAPLARALDGYSLEAESAAGYFNPQFAQARSLTEKYDGNAQYDLVHLLDNINAQTGCKSLEGLAGDIGAIMEASIVHEAHWSSASDPEKANHAHGLSVWFPMHAPTADYMETSLARDTGWPGFLETMSGYFQQPGRSEVQNQAAALPLDSDNDGLLDTISVSHEVGAGGAVTVEVYGPDGELFAREIRSSAGAFDIPLGALGRYQAAFYLRNSDGILLNYTLFGTGLSKEGLSVISGHVKSDIGRGLRWVNIALVNADGQTVKSTVTGFDGYYSMEVVVPRDTDGTGLVLKCGYGPDQANVTVGPLGAENIIDFTVGSSGEFVTWFIAAAGILDVAGIICLAAWAAMCRKRKPDSPPPAAPE